jgi:hypothetical protein
VSGAIRDADAAINRRNGAVRTLQLEATNEKRWQLALPKKIALRLDDRPANGCHRNSGLARPARWNIEPIRHVPATESQMWL